MRRLKNLFNLPIYKDDIKRALLYGILSMIIFSLLFAMGDYLLSKLTNFIILIFSLPIFISRMIRRNIYNTHIWYSILVIVLCLLSPLLYNVVKYSAFIIENKVNGFDFLHILNITYNPIKVLRLGSNEFLFGIISMILYISSILYSIKIIKSE